MKKYRKTLIACYMGFIVQAICANFAPLLFVTFHNNYGITFDKLALIPTCFFITQLVVDFSCPKIVDILGYRFSIIMSEVTAFIGLFGLSFLPDILPSRFLGIIICVICYGIGSAIIEVLINPIVEACPFENKDVMMSLVHSFYCIGVIFVIIGSSIYFAVFGRNNYRILTIIWSFIPFLNIFNFATCPIEKFTKNDKDMKTTNLISNRVFWLLIILMVCAGSSEIAMAQWASTFVESALHISKPIGDLFGPCAFAITMGISRILYSKFGEKIDLITYMLFSGFLCVVCYLVVGLSNISIFSLIGFSICGFSVGIMWPGSISISTKVLPNAGTAMFALLALGGDLGGVIGPAIVGNIAEKFSENLKIGILFGVIFPVVLIVIVFILRKNIKKDNFTI